MQHTAGNILDCSRDSQLVDGRIFKGWKKPTGSLGEHDRSAGYQLSELIISILSARLFFLDGI